MGTRARRGAARRHPGSLTPLWRWVAGRITALEDEDVPFDPEAPAPHHRPSWARYGVEFRRGTPGEVVTLLDGFVSYLGDVITAGAPDRDAERLERWVTGWLTARIPELGRASRGRSTPGALRSSRAGPPTVEPWTPSRWPPARTRSSPRTWPAVGRNRVLGRQERG